MFLNDKAVMQAQIYRTEVAEMMQQVNFAKRYSLYCLPKSPLPLGFARLHLILSTRRRVGACARVHEYHFALLPVVV